jgi:hypothetical protein
MEIKMKLKAKKPSKLAKISIMALLIPLEGRLILNFTFFMYVKCLNNAIGIIFPKILI